MTDTDDEKPKSSDSSIPPPMDPYATYQTPYERRRNDQTDQNPFIEFRRFADKQIGSMFEGFGGFGFPQIFQMADDGQKFRDQVDRDVQALRDQIRDQKLRFEEAMRTRAEHATAEMARTAQPPLLENPTERSSGSSANAVETLPDGWVQATTSDGKKYFIECATGTATSQIPVVQTNMPCGWETKIAKSGRPYYINHNDRTTIWLDPRVSQQESEQSGLSAEERAEKWRRGFRNCPELKKHNEETELDVYERLDEQQQDDLAQLSRQLRERRETWKRGFQNCPELKQLNEETELDMYEHLAGQTQDESTTTARSCPWEESTRSPWSWWLRLGHDGMQRAKQVQLLRPPNDEAREKVKQQCRAARDGHMPGIIPHFPRNGARPPQGMQETIPNLMMSTGSAGSPMLTEDEVESMLMKHMDPQILEADQSNIRQEGGTQSGNTALQDYQTQRMMLEQYHKNRRMVENGLPVPLNPFVDRLMDDMIASVDDWAEEDDDEMYGQQHEVSEAQQTEHESQRQDVQQWSSSFNSASTLSNKEDKPSIVSTMTRTTSRTLPDGSIETKRVLKKRFADGREESEESTDISHATKAIKQQQHQKPGWFWN